MKKKIIPLNWKDELEHLNIDSINNDIALLEKPVIGLAFDHPFKTDSTAAIICLKGSIKGSINLKAYNTQAPCLFIVLSDQILQYESVSDDFSGLFIVMSKQFTNDLFVDVRERLPLFLSIQDQPWTSLNEGELESMIVYYKMIQQTIRMKENPHRLEIIRHLTQAFFYGLSYQFHKISESVKKTKQEILVERFLNEAKIHYKEQRGLDFYSNKLCLTPKYLSKVVKEYTGTSASEWIDNYVTFEAKALLKSTNMTIQQISDELNFPSQSFFGKYFKRNTGVSPQRYRSDKPEHTSNSSSETLEEPNQPPA